MCSSVQKSVQCHQNSVPKGQAKEQAGVYKKPKIGPTIFKYMEERKYICSCMDVHAHTLYYG